VLLGIGQPICETCLTGGGWEVFTVYVGRFTTLKEATNKTLFSIGHKKN